METRTTVPRLPKSLKELPKDWAEFLGHATLSRIDVGMSGADVFRVATAQTVRFLKLGRGSARGALRDEIARTRWLRKHGVPVPDVLRVHDSTVVAMLMSSMPGTTADTATLPIPTIVSGIAGALARLHAVPSCPFDESFAQRLRLAAKAVARGAVDPADFDDRNRDVTPAALLVRLRTNVAAQQHATVHGDATLSNIVIAPDGRTGFIDCGNAGRGDPYLDLALAADGIAERFGPVWARVFLEQYGLRRWNRRKANYVRNLYELF